MPLAILDVVETGLLVVEIRDWRTVRVDRMERVCLNTADHIKLLTLTISVT